MSEKNKPHTSRPHAGGTIRHKSKGAEPASAVASGMGVLNAQKADGVNNVEPLSNPSAGSPTPEMIQRFAAKAQHEETLHSDAEPVEHIDHTDTGAE